jgi:hypothetical protein
VVLYVSTRTPLRAGVGLKRDPSTAAYRITAHLRRKVANLDSRINADAKDKALLAAYLAMVEGKLAAATAYYTWVGRAVALTPGGYHWGGVTRTVTWTILAVIN